MHSGGGSCQAGSSRGGPGAWLAGTAGVSHLYLIERKAPQTGALAGQDRLASRAGCLAAGHACEGRVGATWGLLPNLNR